MPTKESDMHVSDGELGLAMGFGARLRADARQAQAVVDSKNCELAKLRRRIAALERENAALKADRTARHRAVLLESLARH